MTTLYCARWVLPISSLPIHDAAIAVDGKNLTAVGKRAELSQRFPRAHVRNFADSVILPGLVNSHSHLELTAMRGFLDPEEGDFLAWLKKLTVARLERMTPDDLCVSAAMGACEAARAGITCVADSSDTAAEAMTALRDVGLRGIVFQESFGPDPKFASENVEKLKAKISHLRELETPLVRVGVSPHAPYTVCAPQLELISELVMAEKLPLMMHAAESLDEDLLIREGRGPFADGLARRGIEWRAPGLSTIQYLQRHRILEAQPLLAHCVNVDAADIETIKATGSRVAHCPKSNAKLGHGRAPFSVLLDRGIRVGLGSDSVASNNICDILEEARFATLISRAAAEADSGKRFLSSDLALGTATLGGASALGLEGQIGELREGLQADFAILSLHGAHQQPCYSPVDAVIFASSGRDVVLTVVAGREVYSEGQVTSIDENRLRARMKEIAAKLRT